ncbi:hypothetical protein GCM10012275_19680 [Longimycelium tulufanense]|uniref:YcaO domain-containing protein n=1 Tax=Longimycelium tulufanense TaxID=907463 RepID=A0A8J3CD60_9PSEU|nr:YcaO-like family protein [Longimycelium tulufanense]GGM48847.1 hypothetical protein GCM10012275_19680 [Longimycelium tulufanense]
MPEQVNSASAKVYFHGTHRVRSPEETWETIEPILSTFGITRIADVTGLDIVGIPVYTAYRPLARTLSVSQGKGSTSLSARISAAMEAIELWHAEYAWTRPDIRSAPAADLNLPYQLDQLGNLAQSLLNDHVPLDWSVARGVRSGTEVPVPFSLVHLALTPSPTWTPSGLASSSNGLASGNSYQEAVAHAFYEVIERDAIAQLTSSGRDGRITVDPATVSDPTCAELIAKILSNGMFFEIALVPNRWRIPCFVAHLWSQDFPTLAAGAGAHSAPGVALSRAVTEAAQSRLTAISGSREDLAPMYSHVRRGEVTEPAPAPDLVPFAEVTGSFTVGFDDVGAEVAWLGSTVEAQAGTEPVVLDLSTRRDFAVVKLICPGLSAPPGHDIPFAVRRALPRTS